MKLGITMTPPELKAALKSLGWSQAELSSRLGIHVNTISKWMKKPKEPIPQYASAYVRLASDVDNLATTAGSLIGRKSPKK